MFICRWQNGDFSAVSAASRDEAMELLDEAGNADVADLFTVKNLSESRLYLTRARCLAVSSSSRLGKR